MRAACVWRAPNLGTNKKAFDAEVYVIYRALCVIDQKQESGHQYTAFVGSASTIERVRSNTIGPGQRFAVASIEVCSRILGGDNEATAR